MRDTSTLFPSTFRLFHLQLEQPLLWVGFSILPCEFISPSRERALLANSAFLIIPFLFFHWSLSQGSGIICPLFCLFVCTLKREYHIFFLFLIMFCSCSAAIYSCHVAVCLPGFGLINPSMAAVCLKQQCKQFTLHSPQQYPQQISGKAGADILTSSVDWIELTNIFFAY